MQDVIKKLMLVVLAFSLTFTTDIYAQDKKPTSKKSTSELKKKKPKKYVQSSKSSKKKKSRKVSRYRYKRNPNAPDITKLTTEDPDAKYIQAPNNGVNNIEL